MRILILEGVATSGKSTIIQKLQDDLTQTVIRVYGEPDTHIPIMQKPHDLHIEFFEDLVQRAVDSDANLVIFDRLYLTQVYRAGAAVTDYEVVEKMLSKQNTLIAYLKVNENSLAERVKLATQHREETWGEYVKTKGDTFEDIAHYYITQQRNLLELLNKSKIPSRVFDSTNHNYDEITQEIVSELGL
jgi:thymidylate kinase